MVDEVLQMYGNSELNEILKLLMDPTWVATGLKIDFDKLVSDNLWCMYCFSLGIKNFPLYLNLVVIFKEKMQYESSNIL